MNQIQLATFGLNLRRVVQSTRTWTFSPLLQLTGFQPVVVELAWDPVPSAPGFNPASGIGFYQINVDPWPPESGQGSIYGFNLIKSTFHFIPWEDFILGAPGNPDGFNLGVGLNRFPNGTYQIRMDSFSVPPPGSAGVNLECTAVDFGEALLFEKTSNSIQFP